MIKTKTFRKHYIITVLVLILFILFGLFLNHFIIRLQLQQNLAFQPEAPLFYAKLMAKLNSRDHVAALKEIERLGFNVIPLRTMLLNNEGKVLYPEYKNFPLDWRNIEKPIDADYPILLRGQEKSNEQSGIFGPPGSPPMSMYWLVLLPGQPQSYLFIYFEHRDERHPFSGFYGFWISAAVLLFSLLMGVGFALIILFKSFSSKISLADSVISRLQKGDLKARFPIKKYDEIGQLMSRFNNMADEIERLVEQLRNVEHSRMALLQELAHDLRTPVASLKNLIDTITHKKDSLNPNIMDELTILALKEVDYVERLVEDLLFLARVSEPRYKINNTEVVLNTVIDEEFDSITLLYMAEGFKGNALKELPEQTINYLGDVHLLRRLLRNMIDNAFVFAKSEVKVQLKVVDAEVVVVVEDDGPGFSDEALKKFGQRRMTRTIGEQGKGRLSVGLGSVIMKAVTYLHRGKIVATNIVDENGSILGARVTVRLLMVF